MTKLSFVNRAGVLQPLGDQEKEYLNKKMHGTIIQVEVHEVRNPKFHKKYFAMINFAYDYWNPKGGLVSAAEKNVIEKFCVWLGKCIGYVVDVNNFGDEYLKKLQESRSKHYCAVEKSFDAFREWITIEAGFYDVVLSPNGPKKMARSISFAKMDETMFQEVYKATFSVIWNKILIDSFESQGAAQVAIDKAESFI